MHNKIFNDIINDSCYICRTNQSGIIIDINDNFSKISGYSKKELINNDFSKIKSYDTNSDFYKNMWQTILQNKPWNGIIKNISKDGDEFYLKTTIYPILDDEKNIIEFLYFSTNITYYMNLVSYDKLTSLKSRETLNANVNNEKEYICILVNLDNFSDINEFYGGTYGDMVLKITAQRLTRVFKGSDIYRLQGDEFAILKQLPNKYDKNKYEDIVKNKIRSIFEEEFIFEDTSMHITATTGVSIGALNNLRNANLALKSAKLHNINFALYEEKMLNRFANFAKNKKIAGDIKEAIKTDKIIPYYQPIIDNKTRKVVKYEALARLIKEDEIVPPGAFINISKKIKYYHEITRAIVEKSFENFGDNSTVGISINLAIEDISNLRTFNMIISLLSKNKHNSNITFELVETDGIEDYEMFDKFVKTIRKFGAKISIDDFGTGYSNFIYLANIEPDYLKIDGSLIKNIEHTKDFDVVKTIINFAKMYNIKTVAEYVENEEIYILVKELGIDYSQGYYFSKPLALDELKDEY